MKSHRRRGDHIRRRFPGGKDNLDWDLGFIFALAGMSFCELKSLSYSNKARLLSEINELIRKYKELPDEKKQIDCYDL